MTQDVLDTAARTRIASWLYKLAIRVLKVSKLPLEPEKALAALDRDRLVAHLVSRFTPAPDPGALHIPIPKVPSVQKVLAARTIVPGQGPGVRLDLVFGPIFLREANGELGAVTKKSVSKPGLPPEGLLELEKLEGALASVFGGVLPQTKLITADVRDLSDRLFRLDHSYDTDSGKRVWKIIHTQGQQKGQVAYYENPKVRAQMEKNPDLDPWCPAIFRSGKEAAEVLNTLTRGTSLSSRSFPKFKEYTVYFKYSSVYLQKSADSAKAYSALDALLTSGDADAKKAAELSAAERKALVEKTVAWIIKKDANPEALMSTLRTKSPELAKQFEPVLPDIYAALEKLPAQKEAV